LDGADTLNMYGGPMPGIGFGTYDAGLASAARVVAMVVVFTLAGEQHVSVNSVTVFPITTGDRKY
jgi:hypothetical protein